MTSAETIVKQYLERGYSLESLRLLAESREMPQRAEMLAAIDRIEAEAEVVACEEDSGPCETAAYPVAEGGEDMVFFVAADESGVDETGGVDFDVMADTAPAAEAAGEESVAETVAESCASESPPEAEFIRDEALPAGLTDDEKQGLWSRLWTKVASAPLPAAPAAQHGPYGELPEAEEAPAGLSGAEAEEEPAAAEISASGALCETVPEETGAREPVDVSETADGAAPAGMPEEPAVSAAGETDETEADATADDADALAQSEASSDYIPGSASARLDAPESFDRERIEEEKRRLLDAQQALADADAVDEQAAETTEDAMESPAAPEEIRDAAPAVQEAEREETAASADEPVEAGVRDEAAAETETVAFAPPVAEEHAIMEEPAATSLVPARPASKLSEAKKSARRERRRQRARKRKEKRDAIKAAADMPEIVLTRSEGTETLSIREEGDVREFGLAETREAGAEAMLPARAAEEPEEPVSETAEAPAMGEPIGLITPIDVIDDDSQLLSEAASAPVIDEDEAENPLAALIALTDEQAADSADAEQAGSSEEEQAYAGGDDHLMIIANGGAELERVEEAGAEADAEEGRNVILFSEKFSFYADEEEDGDVRDESIPAANYLRMLPPVDAAGEPAAKPESAPAEEGGSVAAAASEEAPARLEDYLADATRLDLLRMICGAPEPADAEAGLDDIASAGGEHSLIVSLDPEPTLDELLAKEAAIRSEMEREYQIRLDEFAARLLDVQSVGAAAEGRLREKQEELDARCAVLDEMKARLEEGEEREKGLRARIESADAMSREKDRDLSNFKGLREEHQRLYNEFEDLRRAYNEVVADVLPGLQRERDDLALTVESQCAEEKELRSALKSTRRRVAAGYSLGTAAVALLVALPAINWINSSGHEKELAVEHQKLSELRESLKREVDQGINSQNRIIELENKVKMARAQLGQLQSKNQELVRIHQETAQNAGLAVFKPTESGAAGTPTRATTMALQAVAQPGGRLHVNEIRDPAGSIEQVVAENRERNSGDAPRMADAGGGRPAAIPLNSVARTDNGQAERNRSGAGAAARNAEKKATDKPVAREGEVLATVKSGEGVAQVVYRQLGTWDPEVVRWVIQENKIKTDRRGNPVIHPNQVLRLPKDGRAGQAASASRR